MILVIGATGTIGREVVKGLKAKGEQVRAMIHDPEKKTAAREPGMEYVTGDLAKPESVVAVLQGIEKAFLQARGQGSNTWYREASIKKNPTSQTSARGSRTRSASFAAASAG